MPMQVGTMMVVVRAQDFASRTLRRVSGELNGMSRAQMLSARRSQLLSNEMRAQFRVQQAQADLKPLRLLERRAQLLGRVTQDTKALADAQQRLRALEAVAPRGPGGRFLPRSAAFKADMATVRGEMSSLSKSIDMAHHQVGRIDEVIGNLGGRYRRLSQSTFAFNKAQSAANARLREAYYGLNNAQRAQYAFNQAMQAMPAQRMAQIGHALSGIGRTMQLIGLIGVGVFGAMANSFAKFSTQLNLAATQTGPVGTGLEVIRANAVRLQKSILNLMMQFPATAEEMSKAAYDIFSSIDVSFGGGIQLLKRFNQLAVATGSTLEEATSAGITVLNNFGATSKNVNEVLNLMVATVRFGRMRLADFNQMLNKVAPAAANAGQRLKDVAGAMALITTRQPSQREAATGIARLFQVFQDPDFQEGVRRASGGLVDITKATGGLKPLPIIMNDLAAAFGKITTLKGAAQLFRELTAAGRGTGRGLRSTIQAQRAYTFIMKNLKDFNTLQLKSTQDVKEFARSLEHMSKTPGVRWEVFINQMRVLVLLIGEKAIPVFLQLGDYLQKAVKWVQGLSEHTRGMIIRFSVFAAVGTLVAGVILGIAGPVVAMLAHFKMWRAAAGPAAATTLRFAAALKMIPLIGLGVLLEQIVGIQRAVKIMALGWIAWKIAATTAAAVVAAANVAAATTVRLAWRAALTSTGVGLLVVAFGLAAEYTISHWKKVKDWFQRFWDWLRITAMEVALDILEPFSHIPGKLGQPFRDAKNAINKEIGGIRIAEHMREEVAQNNKVMDAWLKRAPKQIAAQRRAFQRQLKTGEFMPGMNRETVRASLKLINDAYKRARKAREGKKEGKLFSEEFWRVESKDFSDRLSKMYKQQVEGTGPLSMADKMKNWRRDMDQYKEAWKNYQQQIVDAHKQATQTIMDNLRSMYDTMLQENQTAMGELFQGPWLTSQTFDIAKEWGIQPRIQDMIKDLQQQNNVFARWRQTLDRVLKKGLPRGFVDEIRKMGPEQGQAFIDNILKAKPGQLQKLIAQWKRRNAQIQSATKMDFKSEIERFRKAGVDMGQAIINGFQSAQTAKWFDNWVRATFPGVINNAIAASVREWKASNPPPEKPVRPTDTAAATAARTAGVTRPATTNNDNSKKWEVHVQMPRHDEGSAQAYAYNKEAARRAAFAVRNVLKGLT